MTRNVMTPTNEQIERFVKEVRALTLEQQATCMRHAVYCCPVLILHPETVVWVEENAEYIKNQSVNQVPIGKFEAFTPFIGEFMELLRAQDPKEGYPAGN